MTYKTDPDKVDSLEVYTKAWIPLVEWSGGTHHGNFLPHEVPNDLGLSSLNGRFDKMCRIAE